MIGIYMIKNTINQKVYIGQASNIKSRWKYGHVSPLKNNKHDNTHLQKSWNKYKEENFEFSIIETFENYDKQIIDTQEKYWIKHYRSNEPQYGYNKTDGGEGGKPNAEIIKKLSNIAKNRSKLTEQQKKEIRNKIKQGETIKSIAKFYNVGTGLIYKIKGRNLTSIGNTGKKHSKETREKISKASKQHKHSEETKEKISKSNTGKILTEQTRKRISESKKGSTPWNKGSKMDEEYSKMISERFSGQTPWNKGKTWSEETKKKISESKKGKPSGYKIQPKQYPIIMERLSNREKPSVIASDYNVTVNTIYNIRKKGLK